MALLPFQPEGEAIGKMLQGMQYAGIYDIAETFGGRSNGKGGGGDGSSSGSSSSGAPWSAPAPGPQFQWSFPQYSQTWAFTPPAPSAFTLPPKFDPKSKTGYYTPPKPKTSGKSISQLLLKYK